jgi:RHS repeat-associated protein
MMNRLQRTSFAVLFLFCALLCTGGALADDSDVLAPGFKPNGVFQVNDFDSVNTFNGNLMLNVPIGGQYRSNGTLGYQFMLHYDAHIWDLLSNEGISFASASFSGNVLTTWEYTKVGSTYYWTQVPVAASVGRASNSFDPNGPPPNAYGIESVARGNAGIGWNFSFGELLGATDPTSNELTYLAPDGTMSKFTGSMHGDGGTLSHQPVMYTNDNTYLRMRVIRATAGDSFPQREVDFPDGTRKRFRCVSDCQGRMPKWLLDFVADPYGNVLRITYSDLFGHTYYAPPAGGIWQWTITESSMLNAENAGTGAQYYDGTQALATIRTHYAYFTAPHEKETRLERLALAVLDGNYAFYDFVYKEAKVAGEIGVSWPKGADGLYIKYVEVPGPNNTTYELRAVSELAGIRLPSPLPAASAAAPAYCTFNCTYASGSAGAWTFRYYDDKVQYDSDPAPVLIGGNYYPGSRFGARLRMAKSPTGGGYKYEYTSRGFPAFHCGSGQGGFHGVSFTAVSKRQMIDQNENEITNGAWYYFGGAWLRNADIGTNCPVPREFVTAVIAPPTSAPADPANTNPYSNLSRISLGFYTMSPDRLAATPPQVDIGWDHSSWPYTEEEMLCASGRNDCGGHEEAKYLSSREVSGTYGTFAADPRGAVRKIFARYLRSGESQTPVTQLRSTWVRYESSFDSCQEGPGTGSCVSSNLRKTLERQVFDDDGGAYIETAYSEFDGLGHYRHAETTSDFQYRNAQQTGGIEDRISHTIYNPLVSYQAGATLPSGAPGGDATHPDFWFLGMYVSSKIQEDNVTFMKLVTFDADRGFIASSRSLKNTTNGGYGIPVADPTDTMVTTTRTGALAGNVPAITVRESFFGGDEGSLTTATYVKESVYRYGSLERAYYKGCDLNAGPFLTLQTNSLDPSTGLSKSSAGSSGAPSFFDYDAMQRITKVTPPSGVVAPTSAPATDETPQAYTYSMATAGLSGLEAAGGVAATSTVNIARGNAGDVTYTYDAFGRIKQKDAKLPGSAVDSTTYGYSIAGLLIDEKTTAADSTVTAGKTAHKYDVLGREESLNLPDGRTRDFIYSGPRSTITRNNQVVTGSGAFNAVTHSELRDGSNRLRRVNDNKARADYEYDADSHLTKVTVTEVGNSANNQVRKFFYDGRGFLTSELLPELGPGTLNHQNIDALGHAQSLEYPADGSKNLTFTFDKAERLIAVTAVQPPIAGHAGQKLIERFDFYPESSPVGTRGNLQTALRNNYVPMPYQAATTMRVPITTDFQWDFAGRLTSAKLSSNYNGAFSATTGYHYDSLDQTTQIDYPALAATGSTVTGPARNVTNTFSRGLLTSIGKPGSGNDSFFASIAYYTDGTLKNVSRTRGTAVITDTVKPDTSGLKRPAEFWWDYISNGHLQTAKSGAYSYDGAGNIYAIGDDRYQYDEAYRLKLATVDGRNRTYVYDPFGNMTSWSDDGGRSASMPASASTNRMSNAMYDALGNVIQMPDGRPAALVPGGPANPQLNFKFDLLSAMTGISGNLLGRIFLYDADGERVAMLDYQTADTTLREHWYLRGGKKQVLRDFDRIGGVWSWSRDYIYRGSKLSSTVAAGEALRDVHADHLGSSRFVTDAAGQFSIVDRIPILDANDLPVRDPAGNPTYTNIYDAPHKYWPFGDLTVARARGERMAFTGHERDVDGTGHPEGDLDYMHARYYTPFYSRFLSVDPAGGNPARPQSWNRYTYVSNNPMLFVDLNGAERNIFIFSFSEHAADGLGASLQRATGWHTTVTDVDKAELNHMYNVSKQVSHGDIVVVFGHAGLDAVNEPIGPAFMVMRGTGKQQYVQMPLHADNVGRLLSGSGASLVVAAGCDTEPHAKAMAPFLSPSTKMIATDSGAYDKELLSATFGIVSGFIAGGDPAALAKQYSSAIHSVVKDGVAEPDPNFVVVPGTKKDD